MAQSNHLIMNLLRIITPEEVGEITTKHNGGKFVALTDLVNERVQKNIFRNFSSNNHQAEESSGEAKILPFRPDNQDQTEESKELESADKLEINTEGIKDSLHQLAKRMQQKSIEKVEHVEDENMSSFILIEKARLKKSQQQLKQKEILELYQKNINVDVEQIRGQEDNLTQSRETGVLVNKKQF